MRFFRIEKETHIFPIELAEDGRVIQEAQGHAIRIHVGKVFLIIGLLRCIH
ncbi:MAG: hypothetical protein QXG35_09890 [Nitrososphaerota archaeon]